MTTGPQHAHVRDYPVDANGHPVLSVVPGKWGFVKAFYLNVGGETGEGVKSILEAIQDYYDEQQLLDPEAPSFEDEFPAKTMEIVGWLLTNTTSSLMYVAGPEVDEGLGAPLKKIVSGTPGVLGMSSDITKTYIWSPVPAVISITIIGRNFNLDDTPSF